MERSITAASIVWFSFTITFAPYSVKDASLSDGSRT